MGTLQGDIRSLWETHTLSEMMKIMADDHNFNAT
jgi:hypothetical protein